MATTAKRKPAKVRKPAPFKIEWTDATWNPVIGCTPVSPGCLNCYAARMAMRMQENPGTPEYHARLGVDGQGKDEQPIRIAEVRGGRPVFTGEVRCLPDRLAEPLKWRKPRRVFVNSMSDLFHEDVPFEFIDRVFAVMALCPQHTFQVLTKRPERMAEYFNRPWAEDGDRWLLAVRDLPAKCLDMPMGDIRGPLPNVWLGTSVENQKAADERIPHLLRCPAAVRFLSCEPLLSEVDLSAFMGGAYVGLPGDKVHPHYNFGLHWVIAGGESGPGARSCDVLWIESLARQCREAGVPCFVKQLGEKPMLGDVSEPHGWPERDGPVDWETGRIRLRDRKGGDPAEWPEHLRVREWPRGGGA